MNSITRQYIREVKALFPSKGKRERDYLNKLRISIDEFCEEEQIDNKQAVYEKYGKPIEIVYDYYSSLDTEAVVKKIRFSLMIKLGLVLLICLALIVTVIYAITRYEEHEWVKSNVFGTVVEEEPIVTGRWDDNGNPLPLDHDPYFDTEGTLPTK